MCRKKKDQIRKFEVAFISLCTKGEGEIYKTRGVGEQRPLDKLYSEAEAAKAVQEIHKAMDDDGDLPIHIAAECGNPEVVEWIINKKEMDNDMNSKNGNNMSPLFLASLKGYVGAEGLGSRTDAVKAKRLETAKLLVGSGANVNFVREVVGLTPLHWAAYNDDAELVRFLLANGAQQTESAAGSMPVDIAGFMSNRKVIRVFMEHAAAKIDAKHNNKGTGEINLNDPLGKPAVNEVELLSKMEKSDKTGQYKVVLVKAEAKELVVSPDFNEKAIMRVFYWAAYFGKQNFVLGYMIMLLKWSPFIKSFQKQSVLTAAIRGKQTELIRKMANFIFVSGEGKRHSMKIFEEWVVDNWFGKDLDDNNPLHYAYLSDMPDIRQILRQSKFDEGEDPTAKKPKHAQKTPANQRMNRRSQVPSQMRHMQKCEASSDESDEDGDGADSEEEKAEEEMLGKLTGGGSAGNLGTLNSARDAYGLMITDYSIDNPQYVLKSTKRLSKKQKIAFYNDPDYCFIVQKEYMPTMREALEPLLKSGGIYYSYYDRNSNAGEVIMVVYVDDILLDVMGEILKVKCRMSNYRCMVNFKCYASDLFEQFDNRQTQSIIQQTFNMNFDLGYLVKSKVVKEHFPVHAREEEREKIKVSWDSYGSRLSWGFLTGNYELNMQPLNFIKDYYGSQFGMYFAWLVHYTGMLIIPSIAGIIIFVVQIVNAATNEKFGKWQDAFNTPLNSFYAIFVILWTTYFVESWKRKQNKIADMWLMRDYEDPTLEREEFKAAYFIDRETKSTDKVSRFNTYSRQVYVGIPISVGFILAVIATQLFMKGWADANVEEYGQDIPMHLKFTPSMINVGLIFFYGATYKVVAKMLVDWENHRYEHSYEDSLINKMYMFQFINSYISNYIIAYWVRDFGTLVTNLIVIMVFKQVGANIAEMLMDKILIGRKIRKVKELFETKTPESNSNIDADIAKEDLHMHCHIEEQLVMAPASDTLIYFYNEAIIQLGFIVFFACVFPLAPLFSFLTNLLEVKIKLNRMSSYSRRFPAQGASGIGSWEGVMELISMVSIPINIAILLFTAKGKQEDGEFGYSATVQYLLDRADGRTLFEVVLILVLTEHLLLAAKILMAQLIPDVPGEVIKDERKRPRIVGLADAEIQMLKRDNDLKNIEEIMEEITRENKAKAEKKVQQTIQEQVERNVEFDPEATAIKLRKRYKVNQNVGRIQEKAIEQQQKLNKLDKLRKNKIRRVEKKNFKEIKKDRGVINLNGASLMLNAGGDFNSARDGKKDNEEVDPSQIQLDYSAKSSNDNNQLIGNDDDIAEENSKEGSAVKLLKKNPHVFDEKPSTVIAPSTIIEEEKKKK